jgi:hypothetical protein
MIGKSPLKTEGMILKNKTKGIIICRSKIGRTASLSYPMVGVAINSVEPSFFNSCIGRCSPFGSTRHCGQQWPIVPAPGDYDEKIGLMIGRANWSTRRKPCPVPLCPPQNLQADRTQTRAAAVGSQRLTAWATARHEPLVTATTTLVKKLEYKFLYYLWIISYFVKLILNFCRHISLI